MLNKCKGILIVMILISYPSMGYTTAEKGIHNTSYVSNQQLIINKKIVDKGGIDAVLHLFEVANHKLIKSNNVVAIAKGSAKASEHTLNIRSILDTYDILIKSKERLFCERILRVNTIRSSLPMDLLKTSRKLVNKAHRMYSRDGIHLLIQRAKGDDIIAPSNTTLSNLEAKYSNIAKKIISRQEYKKDEFVNYDIGELTNFILNSSTISKEDYEILYDKGLYKVIINLNQDNSSMEEATKLEKARLHKGLKTKGIKCVRCRFVLDLKDNGQVQRLSRHDEWHGSISLGTLNVSGKIMTSLISEFCWDPAKCNMDALGIDTSWA